jgi:hypothetical protein
MKNKLILTANVALALIFGCTTESQELPDACEVRIELPSPTAAFIGETVSFNGNPLTEIRDTVLLVGGETREIIDLSRTDCDACDSCRFEAIECSACGDCDECDAVCNSCVESISFAAPDMTFGETYISIYNLYGASNNVPLTIIAPEDSTTTDTASTNETGTVVDTGSTDDTGNTTDTGTTGTE